MINRPLVPSQRTVNSRSEPRVKVAWYGHLAVDDGRRLAVKVVDVSESGAGIVGDDKLPIGQSLALQVGVPRLPDMTVQNVVLWRATVVFQTLQQGTWRTGLRFVAATDEDLALRNAWVKRSPWLSS
jgi:hypothetical protein